MSERKRKIIKYSVLSFFILIVIGFFLNWYLTNKLEGFLRSKLDEKVAELTNGFYKLSFDNLSIGFFSGELKIDGLDIRPDSVVYEKWMKGDSLPDIYLKLHIESIDFKGINLTWRRNYRELHFNLFEITTPDVAVFKPYMSVDKKNEINNGNSKSLYETVAPFFDVISVKKLNLANASVSYTLNDSIIPVIYALRDVTFNAYKFRLDETSSKNGKLLYCDNIDFTTNQKQQLIANYQFALNVDSVAFDTKDSTVKIRNVELLPQRELWNYTDGKPDNIIYAKIDTIAITGAFFKRTEGRTFLQARSFDIMSPDIDYFVTDTIGNKKNNRRKTMPADTALFQSWSLYEILSPVLQSISIDRINLNKTSFKYANRHKDGMDIYQLNDFNFTANEFLIDTINDSNPQFLYSKSFAFEANDLNGHIESKNHNINIKYISLDTEKGKFRIEKADITPISIYHRQDYLQGTIDTIDLDGLVYGAGISAGLLKVESPRINYYRYLSPKSNIELQQPDTVNQTNVLDLFTSSFQYFFIKDIRINNANFIFNDRNRKETVAYHINHLNFGATDFLINEKTRNKSEWYFDCSDFWFNLKNFNNYLLGNDYRLMVKNARFTGLGGRLILRDIKLLPQQETWAKSPDIYFTFISPLLTLDRVGYSNRMFTGGSLNLQTPYVKIVKEKNNIEKENIIDSSNATSTENLIRKMFFNTINVNDIVFEYIDKTKKDSLNNRLSKLSLKNIQWDSSTGKGIQVKELLLKSPEIFFTSKETTESDNKNSDEIDSSILDYLKVGKIDIDDLKFNSALPEMDIDFDLDRLLFTDLDWTFKHDNSHFKINEMDFLNPVLGMKLYSEKKGQDTLNTKNETSIYSALNSLSENISIDKLRVKDGIMDYSGSYGIKPVQRKLNTINFELDGLIVNTPTKKLTYDNIQLSTENVNFPISDGFYSIMIDKINLSEKGTKLDVDNVRLVSPYPKMEFAYRHPRHKDWFDLSLDKISVSGINIPDFFANDVLNLEDVQIRNGMLKNFKNQQIEIQHNIMPMIYETLQKSPLKFNVKNMDVWNFGVIYEELAKKGTEPGQILFTAMDGHISGLTNIVTRPQQYIRLDATGIFMGEAGFKAIWKVPVDSLNDRFIMHAHIPEFDLKSLNKIFTPLVNSEILSGVARDTKFDMDASSKGGHIGMLFLYNDLKINVLKEKSGEMVSNPFISDLANLVVRSNNPNKRGKKPRNADIYVERDAYHSTFNYLWQMLQPALGESVGISQKTQNFFKGIPTTMKKLADFFWPPTRTNEKDKEQDK